MINGISGRDKRINDKEWLGFDKEDLEISIDLGEEMLGNSIDTRFPERDGPKVNVKLAVNKSTRFVYLKIPNYGTILEGKQGAGNKPWPFIDEIIVNCSETKPSVFKYKGQIFSFDFETKVKALNNIN